MNTPPQAVKNARLVLRGVAGNYYAGTSHDPDSQVAADLAVAWNAILDYLVERACFAALHPIPPDSPIAASRRLLAPLGITVESMKPPKSLEQRTAELLAKVAQMSTDLGNEAAKILSEKACH